MSTKKAQVIELSAVSNGGATDIEMFPYLVSVTITGSAPFLFHAWNIDGIEAKAKSAKGSAAKKSDAIETYVYRCEDNTIGIPGEYLRMAIVNAAKYRQDPRSPRKSAMDLYKAGIVSLTEIASLKKTDWDYVDRRRVMVQRAGITRSRPAMRDWTAEFLLQVLTPEYINASNLIDVISTAGRLIGIGDFRPTFGRFNVTHYEVVDV